jgi:hypothetical protein
MNADQYVSHRSFSREQLHGRQLAVCKESTPTRCTIGTSAPRPEDGKYVLTLSFGLSLVPLSPHAASALGKEPLSQAMVDKIEPVEKGSPLSRMRFEFAIMQDVLSAHLAKDDTPKITLQAPPPIPVDTTVTFSRAPAP